MRALEAAKIDKTMHFSMLDITLGNQGLDVGCGNGDDVSALAGIVEKD